MCLSSAETRCATGSDVSQNLKWSFGGVQAGVSGLGGGVMPPPGLKLQGQSAPPQSGHGAPAGHMDGCWWGVQVGPGCSPEVTPFGWPGCGFALSLRMQWVLVCQVHAAQPGSLPQASQQSPAVLWLPGEYLRKPAPTIWFGNSWHVAGADAAAAERASARSATPTARTIAAAGVAGSEQQALAAVLCASASTWACLSPRSRYRIAAAHHHFYSPTVP
eukprot:COSAG06_NODE_4392_length_4305_cov_1.890157_4_plen_218_part_00